MHGHGAFGAVPRVLQELVQPSPLLGRQHERRRSKLLAGATFTCLALLAVAMVVLPGKVGTPGAPLSRDPVFLVGAIGVPAYAALYLLNRAGHYRPAAWSFVFVTFDLSWLFTILVQGSGYFVGNYAYLVFTVILAAVFLPWWMTALYAGMNIAGIAILNAAYGLAVQDLWLSYAYQAIFSALLLVTAAMRERDQDNLEEQSDALERIIADTQAMVSHVDASLVSFDRDFCVLAINGPARRLVREVFGADLREGVGLCEALPAPAARALRTLAEPAWEGESVCVEHEADLGGETRHYEVVLQPIRLPRGVAGVSLAVRDITGRVRREEERMAAFVQAKELEMLRERADATQRFLNLASHGLNTPLTPIQIQLAVLRKKAPPGAMQEHALEVLDRNVQRLRGLVRQILDVVQSEDCPLRLASGPVDLDTLVADRVEAMRPSAAGHGVRIKVQPSGAAWVRADVERLTRVLDGLMQNAVQATPAGGTVHVRTVEAAGAVRVEVEDEGVGVPEDARPRLFEPFTQVHPPDSPVRQGAGLGLFLARQAVRAHGGDVDFRGAGGRGSVFWFELPTGTGAAEAEPPRRSPA